jgi:hypothetical protein
MCLAWSGLAAITLAMLLINLYLIADLLHTRGSVVIPAEEAAEFGALLPNEAPGIVFGEPEAAGNLPMEDTGILPTVWRSRNAYWGSLLLGLYRSFPMLGHNAGALLLLILSAFGIGFIRSLLLDASQRLSTIAALDVVTRIRRTLHRQTLRLGPGDLGETGEEHVLSLFTTEMDRLRDGIQTWVYSLSRYPVQRCFWSYSHFRSTGGSRSSASPLSGCCGGSFVAKSGDSKRGVDSKRTARKRNCDCSPKVCARPASFGATAWKISSTSSSRSISIVSAKAP